MSDNNGIQVNWSDELVENLETKARRLINSVIQWVPGNGNDYANFKYNEELTHTFTDDGGIEFRRVKDHQGNNNGGKWTSIKFGPPTPVGIKKQVNHEPVLLDKKIQDVTVGKLRNTGSEEASLELAYESGDSKSFSKNVGFSFGVGFRQQFTVGSEAAGWSVETEYSVTAETSYGQEWGNEHNSVSSIEAEFAVPPWTEVTAVQQIYNSKFRQDIEYWCGLDHSVEVWSHGDFTFQWASMKDLGDCLRGFGKGQQNKKVNELMASVPWSENKEIYQQIVHGAEVYFKTTVNFDEALYSEITLDEKQIEGGVESEELYFVGTPLPVDLSADGNTAIIGVGNGAFIYEKNEEGKWVPVFLDVNEAKC